MNERAAETFSKVAEHYVDITGFARRLVDLAAPARGELVLDVGCGPGPATLAAVERGADVVAVDLAEGMLRRAREVHDVVWPMDARALAFAAGSFDVVVASSVVQFAGPTSLTEWRRVTKPGGRVACSLPFGPAEWFELCARYVAHTDEPFRSTMARTLTRAARRPDAERARAVHGFASVTTDVDPVVQRFDTAEDAWASHFHHGARMFLDALPAPALAAMHDEYVEQFATSGGAELRSDFLYWCFTV